MGFDNDEENGIVVGNDRDGQDVRVGGTRQARELQRVRYRQVGSLQLYEIAREYSLSEDSVWSILAGLQTLGVLILTSNSLASLNSPNPQEMQEAYEIGAALEEIAGRSAAWALKRNTESLQAELGAMRAAAMAEDLDTYVEHDVKFHRSILRATQNRMLLRVWDALAVDFRMRATIGSVQENFLKSLNPTNPSSTRLKRGRGREAGLLLRNHWKRSWSISRNLNQIRHFTGCFTKI